MTGTVFAVSDVSVAVSDFSDDRGYDRWLDTLTEASARLDALQTAVAEIRYLCENGDVSSEQILELLERQRV